MPNIHFSGEQLLRSLAAVDVYERLCIGLENVQM